MGELFKKEMSNAVERAQSSENLGTLSYGMEHVHVHRKTFFSYNVKLLFLGREPNDLFRMRLDYSWRKLIDPNNIGKDLYTKDLKEPCMGEACYGEKVVYEVLRNMKLEVEYVDKN